MYQLYKPKREPSLPASPPGELPDKVFVGEAPPQVQPLTLLYTIFDKNSTPFLYFPLTNGTHFT